MRTCDWPHFVLICAWGFAAN